MQISRNGTKGVSWTTYLHTEEVVRMQLFAEVDEQGFPPDEDNDDDKDDDKARTIRGWGWKWLWTKSEVSTREGRSCTATCPSAFPTGAPPLSFRVLLRVRFLYYQRCYLEHLCSWSLLIASQTFPDWLTFILALISQKRSPQKDHIKLKAMLPILLVARIF